MKLQPFIFILLLLQFLAQHAFAQLLKVGQNQIVEWQYESEKVYENPFREISLHAMIEHTETGESITIPAFWDGGSTWKFRFSSTDLGAYTFITACSDTENKALHGQSGNINVEEYTGTNPVYLHGPVQVSKKGKYLNHKDGTPFFWLADSWWHGMTSRFAFPSDFEILLKDRKEKGFSVIQFAIAFPCDIEPFDIRGRNANGDPWDTSFQSINPSYFQLTDLRVERILESGLVPNIVGLWGYYMKWMGVDNVKKHWEYLVARYGAYPVTYTLSGETTLAYYTDLDDNWEFYKKEFRQQWSEVAQFIQENDPYNRLLTTHPGPGIHDGKNPINEMQWLDMVMLQSGHKGFETISSSNKFIKEYFNRFPDKPIIHGEVCFEGMFGSSWQDVQRLLFWSNVLQGTPGYSYGVEGIWQFNSEDQLFGESPTGATWGNVPWQEAMHYKGGLQIGYGADFLRALPWWTLKPSPNKVSYHADVDNFYDPYAAELDNGLLIYFTKVGFKKNALKILELEPDHTYTYYFFDPITGKKYDGKKLVTDKKGEWLIVNPPIMQDWVLYIEY